MLKPKNKKIRITLLFATVSLIAIAIVAFKVSKKASLHKETYSISKNEKGLSKAIPEPIEQPATALVDASAEDDQTVSVGSHQESERLKQELLEWAKTDPKAALAFAKENIEPATEIRKMLRAILAEWAELEPEAAWDWAITDSRFHLNRLLKVIGKVDPSLAWEKAEIFANIEGNEKFRNIGYISALRGMMHWGNHAEILSFIEQSTIPSIANVPDEKQRFFETVITDWVQYAPDEAATWALSLNEQNAKGSLETLDSVMSAWADTDPLQVIDYASQMPNPESAAKALSEGVFRLAEQDPQNALQLLIKTEPNEIYDEAYYQLAMNPKTLHDTPQLSLELAMSVAQPDRRSDAINDVVLQWYVQNPTEAEQFLAESGSISASERQKIASHAVKRRAWIMRERTYEGWE
ncbi:MAG: hypothetical protein ACSHYA_11725 [Opitutaceae bacterium]